MHEAGTRFVHTGTWGSNYDRSGGHYSRRLLYQNFCVHGRRVADSPAVYLDEAAALHGLRSLHRGLRGPEGCSTPIKKIYMRAGSDRAGWTLAHRFRKGDLKLQSQAVSPLAEDSDRRAYWMKVDTWLSSFTLPTILGDRRSLPWSGKEILCASEEFRAHVAPQRGRGW